MLTHTHVRTHTHQTPPTAKSCLKSSNEMEDLNVKSEGRVRGRASRRAFLGDPLICQGMIYGFCKHVMSIFGSKCRMLCLFVVCFSFIFIWQYWISSGVQVSYGDSYFISLPSLFLSLLGKQEYCIFFAREVFQWHIFSFVFF